MVRATMPRYFHDNSSGVDSYSITTSPPTTEQDGPPNRTEAGKQSVFVCVCHRCWQLSDTCARARSA